jgi:hypothetical protein
LAGDGTHPLVNMNGGLVPSYSVGDKLALSFQVKFLPNAASPTYFGDFYAGLYDYLTGFKVAGYTGMSALSYGNYTVGIGGETGYTAGFFYQEYTITAANAGQGLCPVVSFSNYNGASNVGDSLTIANFEIVNLTKAGIL